jgi:hypothetical protein
LAVLAGAALRAVGRCALAGLAALRDFFGRAFVGARRVAAAVFARAATAFFRGLAAGLEERLARVIDFEERKATGKICVALSEPPPPESLRDDEQEASVLDVDAGL